MKISKEEKCALKEEKKKAKQEKKNQNFGKKLGGGIKGFFADFKKFISRGNIIDLSVAVVIGAAFNKIVTSLVNDVIMPLISLATGGKSVADWKWVIKEATETTAESALYYGSFIQTIIDFLIIALTIFIVLKIVVNSQRGVNNLTKKLAKKMKKHGQESLTQEEVKQIEEVAVPKETTEDILKDIRELLIQNQNQSKSKNNKNSKKENTEKKETDK